MKFRTIYLIEAYTPDGKLVLRTYARNKKVGERILRREAKLDAFMRKLSGFEHAYVMPEWVEE